MRRANHPGNTPNPINNAESQDKVEKQVKKRSVLLAGVLIDLVLAVVLVATLIFGWPPKEAITLPSTLPTRRAT